VEEKKRKVLDEEKIGKMIPQAGRGG